MKIIALFLWLAAASFCTTAQAEALRCNGDLAQVGDSKASVLQKCGEPFFAESFCKPYQLVVSPTPDEIAAALVLPCQLADEWSYNPGAGQFITILRFEAGVMKLVRFGDRIR